MSNEKVLNAKTGKMETCKVGVGCKRHAHNLSSLKPLELNVDSKYYLYSQNNSGGAFTAPAKNVIIQAQSFKEANETAELNGIYFDEEYKIDCECCGRRWNKHSSDNSDKVYSNKEEASKDVFHVDFDKEIPDFLIIEEQI